MTKKANICFDCQRACGYCSWSEYDSVAKAAKLAPVEGWTAKLVRYQNLGYTYEVTDCPLYIPDKPRNVKLKNPKDFKKCCLCGKKIPLNSQRRKYCEECVPEGWYYNEKHKKLFRHNPPKGGDKK